jgi:branched-chain amino acid transport system ATP-binding protein
MLAIGRCLMGDPQFIMLDEPSLGLAPLIVELVFSAIVKLRNSGITILLIEQNVAESLVVADDAAVLENGAVVLAGPAATVLADEGVKRAYLGL